MEFGTVESIRGWTYHRINQKQLQEQLDTDLAIGLTHFQAMERNSARLYDLRQQKEQEPKRENIYSILMKVLSTALFIGHTFLRDPIVFFGGVLAFLVGAVFSI